METKANYAMLGAATIIGALLIMLFAVWLADSEFRRGYDEYDVVFDDPVRGLAEGGEVRFNGIKVGEVQSLRIDADNTNRVIARIRVSAAIPVREDTTGQLEPIGLTGVTLIQLTPGTPTAPLLREPSFGGPTPIIEGEGSQIDLIVARGQEVAMRASEAMAAVRDLLTDENIERVTNVIENLEEASSRLAAQGSVIDTSAAAAANIADTAQSVNVLVQQMQSDLADLDVVLDDVQGAAAVASNRTLPEFALAAEEIRRAANSLSRLVNTWEENPSILTPTAPRPTVELAE
jgi:phospholipid/cholesterol/gamma-HCH transport system substrate-binding protein